MIEVKNVTKEFEKTINKNEIIKFKADNDISFTAKEGEVIGLIGPNGAGKTTLLRLIAGIMTPTEGEVLIDDETYQENGLGIKKKIAYLSGNTNYIVIFLLMNYLKCVVLTMEFLKKNYLKRLKKFLKDFLLNLFFIKKYLIYQLVNINV